MMLLTSEVPSVSPTIISSTCILATTTADCHCNIFMRKLCNSSISHVATDYHSSDEIRRACVVDRQHLAPSTIQPRPQRLRRSRWKVAGVALGLTNARYLRYMSSPSTTTQAKLAASPRVDGELLW